VVEEETASIVDKKLIEVGRNRLAHTEREGYVGDEAGQGLVPVAPSDPNLGGIDLPSSPDFAIDHRLLAPPIGGCLGDCNESLGLDGQDRKGDPAHTVDIDRRHEDLANSADAKVARTLHGTEAVEQRSTDRRHGNPGKRDSVERSSKSTRLGVKKLYAANAHARNHGRASPVRPR
jgi:hypothetical protein